jgi:hypothetical protein
VYKDISYVDREGKRPPRWIRAKLDKIPDGIKHLEDRGCQHIYTTIQTFNNKEHADGEDLIVDFYADFDGESALDDVQKTIEHFVNLGIDEANIGVWFSGNKGFHIVIPREIFGGEISPRAVKIWRILAEGICGELQSWDRTVYSSRRMWRVENTKHGGSGLYKIPLTVEDIQTLSLGEIKALAVKKQTPHYEEYTGDPIPKAQIQYDYAVAQYERYSAGSDWEAKDVEFADPPPCIKAILENGVFELGSVNMVMFRLAAFFKSQGEAKIHAIELMNEWVFHISANVTHTLTPEGAVDYSALKGQVRYVCNTVFDGEQYGFSCQGILQIPGINVYCKQSCKDSMDEKVTVSLFNMKNVENLGKRVYVEAEAVGRKDAANAVPRTVHVWCKPLGSKKCQNCPLYGYPDGVTFEMAARNKNILHFILPSNLPLMGKVGALCGLPSRRGQGGCNAWRYKIEYRNFEVIYLAPRVENEFEEAQKEGVIFTRPQVYWLGYGLEPNQGYEFSGYIHISDKGNDIHAVLDDAVPLSDTLQNFEFTEKMQKQSKIFRPKEDQTLEEKHDDIVKVLNYNYIHLWNRESLIKAIDLVYHSVHSLRFQRELISGRLDILLVGDTRQGKTKAVVQLMRHYDLGIMVSGESAGRTGLLYTIVTGTKEPNYVIWGILPRHTRRLVIIDEVRELIEEGGFKELTQARSEGILTVTKSVFGSARTETRLISMTNTVGRKTMKSYGFPVMSITDLIPHREDISRFTFAVGLASKQVPDDVINQNIESLPEIPNKYLSEVCHDHILWVWNLKPEDIIISSEVEAYVLEMAQIMCSEYSATISLVEPGDYRHKVVRIAAAISARMDSREEKQLIVTKEAVDYATNFINTIYKDAALKYHQYSKAYSQYVINPEQVISLARSFIAEWPEIAFKLAEYFMMNSYAKASEISMVLAIALKDARKILTWCSGYKFIESTIRGSNFKTESGVTFFEEVIRQYNKGGEEF